MKVPQVKKLIMALFSLTCLIFLVILIGIVILLVSIFKKQSSSKIIGTKLLEHTQIGTRNTHLTHKNKKIKLRVAIISDSESDWVSLREAINKAEKLSVDAIFHLGDITILGTPEDLSTAKDLFSKSDLNIYPVPGDRDLWKSKGVDEFVSLFGKNYRMVQIADVKFLLIDNSDEYEGIDDAQIDFIQSNIPISDYVILHNPIQFDTKFILGQKGMGEYSIEVDKQRQDLIRLIRASNTKAVFAGDRHYFDEVIDSENENLFHYTVGAVTSDRNIQSPNITILTVYADDDYFVENIPL